MISEIRLPCSSHRGCTYHNSNNASSLDIRFNDSPATVGAKTINSIAPSESTPSKKEKTPTASPINATVPIQTLPTELLLLTLAYLTTIEQASLSLTCKHFATILGPSLWPVTSKAKGANWRRHDDFLDALQKDFEAEYWRCRDCVLFHPRTKLVTNGRGQQQSHPKPRPLIHPSTLKRLFRVRIREDSTSQVLQLGPSENPVYTITRLLITSILNQHHSSALQGSPLTCLNALKCRGTFAHTISPPSPAALPFTTLTPLTLTLTHTHTHVSKIVLDRLLLRSTYSFALSSTPPIVFPPEASLLYLRHSLVQLPFRICSHLELFSCVELMLQVEAGDSGVKRGRCKFCPTQWIARRLRNKTVSYTLDFRVYQNLGRGELEGREDDMWRFLTQPLGKRMQIYEWGYEDVEEAFERILCSTAEEFWRQLEKSDGRGSWYDPILMRRGYKTLPESVAAAL